MQYMLRLFFQIDTTSSVYIISIYKKYQTKKLSKPFDIKYPQRIGKNGLFARKKIFCQIQSLVLRKPDCGLSAQSVGLDHKVLAASDMDEMLGLLDQRKRGDFCKVKPAVTGQRIV